MVSPQQAVDLCYGSAGVRKTLPARQYAQWDALEGLTHVPTKDRILKTPPFFKTARTVFFTVEVVNSPRKTMETIGYYVKRLQELVYNAEMSESIEDKNMNNGSYCDNWARVYSEDSYKYLELLIVDEADRLKTQTIE